MRWHRRYERERAAEEPLGQAAVGPAKPMLPEFPVKKAAVANSPRPNKTPREIEVHSMGTRVCCCVVILMEEGILRAR